MPTFKQIGEPLLSRDSTGRPHSCVATIFLRTPGVVTLPRIHALQREAWIEALNAERAAQNEAPLSDVEAAEECETSVDLLLDGQTVLIRPIAARLDLAFRADEFLQTLFPKRNIRFLNAANETVRNALRDRGENWRMSPMPYAQEEIIALIAASRFAIGNMPIYYYNRASGTHILTSEAFRWLATLDDAEFQAQVEEVARFCTRRNRLGYPEIDLFPADCTFDRAALAVLDDPACVGADLRIRHAALAAAYDVAVPSLLRADDPLAPEWRTQMYAALIKQPQETVATEIVRGLSAEFYLQVEWLAGARIVAGELIFDPVFDERADKPDDPDLRRLCDPRVRGMIFNYVREFREIEYVNVGRLTRSLSSRSPDAMRTTVYLAEVKHLHAADSVIRILYLPQWGIAEQLDAGKELLQAILQVEEYADYMLDRRLGCQQLGMHLPSQIVSRRISETYTGANAHAHDATYWISYNERPYFCGWATDKLPTHFYQNLEFNRRLAALLGQAAATNLIVGRTSGDGTIALFDYGDEVVLVGSDGLPQEIAVTGHVGTFPSGLRPLEELAPAYAEPVNSRANHMPNAQEFAKHYLDAFAREVARVREEYLCRQLAFDALFSHRPRGEAGSFADRWERVLNHLAGADPQALVEIIRNALTLERPTPG